MSTSFDVWAQDSGILSYCGMCRTHDSVFLAFTSSFICILMGQQINVGGSSLYLNVKNARLRDMGIPVPYCCHTHPGVPRDLVCQVDTKQE